MSPSRSILEVAMRDLARLKIVATAAARHGFGELLMRSLLATRVYAGSPLPEGNPRPWLCLFRR
jgi:hypothetical protein